MRFAVIGSNYIVDRFLAAGVLCPDFIPVALYSRTRQRAQEYGEIQGIPLRFTQLGDLARCDSIEAVYIASPNYCHAEQAIQMLKAGKHVLCEKPVAVNSRELDQMLQAARESGCALVEAMRPTFSPVMAAIKSALPRIGKLRRATISYCQYSGRYDNFKKGIIENAFRPELANGALMDIGVYCVGILSHLFGRPKGLQATCTKLHNGVDAQGSILAGYGDFLAELRYSKIVESSLPCEIQGEAGSILFYGVNDPARPEIIWRDGRREALPCEHRYQGNLNMAYEISAFQSLAENRAHYPQIEARLRIEMEIMDEARRQTGILFPNDHA